MAGHLKCAPWLQPDAAYAQGSMLRLHTPGCGLTAQRFWGSEFGVAVGVFWLFGSYLAERMRYSGLGAMQLLQHGRHLQTDCKLASQDGLKLCLIIVSMGLCC